MTGTDREPQRRVSAARAAVTAAGASALLSTAVYATAGGKVARTMLPWVLGRGLGLAALGALTLLVASGLWFRHPWRRRRRVPGAYGELRVHAALGSAALVLTAAHIVALALDHYAGVGWAGAFVPGRSGYRPVPVALGTAALYLGLLVGLTAALAGRLAVGRHWYAVHRTASAVFVLVWLHAVLAGSDAAGLRPVYVVSGAAMLALAFTRRVGAAAAPAPGTGRQPS